MTHSFQSKLITESSKHAPVYLVTAKAEGKPAWYYVQVDTIKHSAFKKQAETGAADITQFGEILESGWGTHPPEPIDALMREKFAA